MNKKTILISSFFIVFIAVFITYSIFQKEPENGDNISENNIIINNYSISLACEKDSDCTIVDKETSYRGCWPGACAKVDYLLDKYIAVNKGFFEKYREAELKFRPSYEECGPGPECPVSNINMNFDAKCVNKQCKKSPNVNPYRNYST